MYYGRTDLAILLKHNCRKDRNTRRTLVSLVAMLFALLILLHFVEAASEIWTLPSSIISVNISFNETPLINKTVNLTYGLLSVINTSNTTATINLSEGIELIDGLLQWNGSLIENITTNLTLAIKVDSTGNLSIEIRVRDPPSGQSYIGGVGSKFLEVSINSTSVSDVPALNSSWNYTKYSVQINTTSEPPSPPENGTGIQSTGDSVLPNNATVNLSVLRPLINDTFNETNFTNGSTEITVKGRFVFEDRSGNNIGARFITVYLFDSDTFSSDDFLGSALTDENGRFSIGPVSNHDLEGSTQDIYVRFIARSSVATIQDLNGNWYDGYTPKSKFPNVPDGTTDIGTWEQPSDEKEPWWIYDDLIEGWWFMANTANPSIILDAVTVEWSKSSTDGTYYQPDGSNEIHLLAGHANDGDVILHEYGHHIMYHAYGQTMPPAPNCNPHWISDQSSTGCAWMEGWANFVPLIIDNNPQYTDTTQNFQINFESRIPFAPWSTGDEVEGNVAASLWDLSDSSTEDTYDGNFNNDVWNTSERQNDDTFSQYWTAWKADHSSSEEDDALIALAQNTIYYATSEISCANGIDEDGDGYIDCADADCTQGSASQNGFCCGSGCSVNGGSCADASKSGFTCSDGTCNTYAEACQNGELESSLSCSGTSLSCSGGSCEYGFGAPQWCDEITPSDNACESSPGSYDELACEVSGTNCYYEAENSCIAPSGCDEKAQDACSSNSGFQCEWQTTYNDNVVEECESTSCGAISQCDEELPSYDYASCTTSGQTYFADQCSSSCQGEDRGDSICRSSAFDAGCTAALNCNDLATGTDLNTCNQVGQTYYEEECSSTCAYQDVTSVFECTETGCSCSEPLCDGGTTGTDIVTCASGLAYFADECTSTASGQDRGDNVCRSSAFAGGCTAASQCNGVTAGTNTETGSCSATCVFDAFPNVALVSPQNDNVSNTGNVIFNCSATDDHNLVNMTLYHNITGTWQLNETKALSGAADSETFTIINISDNTNFIWNCLAYDNASQTGWADANYSVTVNIPVANITVSSLSEIFSSGTDKVFETIILNNGDNLLENVTWTFDFGDGTTINSTYNASLAVSETMFVYAEHNYSVDGLYNVTATASALADGVSASSALQVSTTVLSVNGLAAVYSNLSERVFEFGIVNNVQDNISVNWTLDFGDGSAVNSIANSNLSGSEELFIYAQHNYSSFGSYVVVASAQSGSTLVSTDIAVQVAEPDQNKFFIRNSTGGNVAWFGDSGNIMLKGILEQNSAHQRSDNFAFAVRNNGEDVLIIEDNGSMYVDGLVFENQGTVATDWGRNDFRVKRNGVVVISVNESGYVFLKGTVTENGSP